MTTVEYQLTQGELILTETLRKLAQLKTLGLIGGLFMVGSILILRGGSLQILGWAGIAFATLSPFIFARAFQRVVSANPILTSRITLSFGDSGIISAADGQRSERQWRSLKRWSQSNKYFFLYVDTLGTAITIPKRAFTEAQRKMFLDQLPNIGGSIVPFKNGT